MMKNIINIINFLKIKFNSKVMCEGFIVIHKTAKVIIEKDANLIFGKNVVIKENSTIYVKSGAYLCIGSDTSTGHDTEISCGNRIEIGSNVIMGAYTYITDSDHNFSDPIIPIKKQGMKIGTTKIGDNVWIGRGAYILRDASVGNRSVIGARSVVTKSFAGDSLIAGIPGKKIRSI